MIVRGSSRRAQAVLQGYDPPPRGHVSARGLVLAASQLSAATRVGGRRFEARQMTIEVEVPGQPPYVTRGVFRLPRGIVEGIPGSSLELSVDPSDQSRIVILGPGGFTGPWLQRGAPRAY
jgi:hypothetical protein